MDTPDALGGLWLPRTAVGDEDRPGDAAALGGDADGVGDPDDGAAEDADAIPVDGDVVRSEGPIVEDALEVARGAMGLRAIDPVDDAAIAAAPSARSAATAMIGSKANRLWSGKRSRQFGQNPETGVVT